MRVRPVAGTGVAASTRTGGVSPGWPGRSAPSWPGLSGPPGAAGACGGGRDKPGHDGKVMAGHGGVERPGDNDWTITGAAPPTLARWRGSPAGGESSGMV
jgi:hypothetical protein